VDLYLKETQAKLEKENHLNFFLGLVFITAMFVIGSVRILHIPDDQLEAGKWVTHTLEVLRQVETLSFHVEQAELQKRNYILTRDPARQSLYDTAISQISDDLKNFQFLTQDNPNQQIRVQPLKKNIDEKFSEMGKAGDLVIAQGSPQPFKIFVNNIDNRIAGQINKQIAEMKSEEESLLHARLQKWNAQADDTQKYFIAGGVLLYMIICVMLGTLYNTLLQRKKIIRIEQAAAALRREKDAHLENIVAIQHLIVGHGGDVEVVLRIMVKEMQKLVGAEGGLIEILEGTDIVCRAASGIGSSYLGLKIDAPGNSLSGLCIRENAVLKCDDSETDPRVDRAACRTAGLRSLIVVPLRHQGAAFGVLNVISSKAHFFNESHISTLELMSGMLSGALGDALVTYNIRTANKELKEANTDLQNLASTDGLTGLENHRTFQKNLLREYDMAIRHKKPLSLLLLDVDYFKKFNDSFGHPAGDVVLKQVALLLKKAARTTDYVARYGGEEFVLVLPETPVDTALIIAGRIQQTVAGDQWEHRPVTVSIGVSSLSPDIPDPAGLIKAADKALYAAKEKGRNCVVQAEFGNGIKSGTADS